MAEIEGLDGAEFEDEVEEDENGAEPAEDEADEQEEEKEPEDDSVPWLGHNQERIISYDERVTKCTHKAKDGRKFLVCHACNKALNCDNDTHHMALNCCPPKVLGQWAKEWSLKQKRIKTVKGQRGGPTSRDAPSKRVKDAEMALKPEEVAEHLEMKEPKW